MKSEDDLWTAYGTASGHSHSNPSPLAPKIANRERSRSAQSVLQGTSLPLANSGSLLAIGRVASKGLDKQQNGSVREKGAEEERCRVCQLLPKSESNR